MQPQEPGLAQSPTPPEAPDAGLPELRVAIHAGTAPTEGFLTDPFAWKDVFGCDPPTCDTRDSFRYCACAPPLEAGTVRVENAVVVTLGHDGRVRDVEDRLVVEERALAAAIQAERTGVGAAIEEKKRHVRRRVRFAPTRVEAAAAKVYLAALSVLRSLTRGVATFPDRMLARLEWAIQTLNSPDGRHRFWRGLTEPHTLSAREKATVLFAGTGMILAGLLLVHVLVTLIVPTVAVSWRITFFAFLYTYITSLGPPLPLEPFLLATALKIGPYATLAVAIVAKTLAAWMVFFLGDEANERLRKEAETKPRLGRILDLSERFAHRFGAIALATFIAVPGLPDVVALYLFGSLHMTMGRFLLAVATGGTILYSMLLFGVGQLIGVA